MANIPMLTEQEVRAFVASIDTGTLTGLRNRAVIGLMAGAGCPPAAVVRLVLDDLLLQDRLLWVRLNQHDSERTVSCPPVAQAWLRAYLDRAGLRDPDALVFRASGMRDEVLSRHPMSQRGIFGMVHDRAEAAGVRARLPWTAFRATGLSLYRGQG